MNANLQNVEINGVEYVRADSTQKTFVPTGKRAVVVVDRGWIFAGDVTEENGRIFLDNAVWVFRWESVGFDGVIADPNNSKVQIRVLQNRVDVPKDAEVFRIPVRDGWGLK